MVTDKKLTRKLAIEYMCHECLGWYSDGKQDCENVKCPLYSYMKYAKKEPDLSLLDYNPSRRARQMGGFHARFYAGTAENHRR